MKAAQDPRYRPNSVARYLRGLGLPLVERDGVFVNVSGTMRIKVLGRVRVDPWETVMSRGVIPGLIPAAAVTNRPNVEDAMFYIRLGDLGPLLADGFQPRLGERG